MQMVCVFFKFVSLIAILSSLHHNYLSPAGAEFVGDKFVKNAGEVAGAQVEWKFIGLWD